MITIIIPGEPVAKGRGRSFLARSGIRVFTPAKTRAWETHAGLCARGAMAGLEPLSGPLWCSISAYIGIPASWPAWKRNAALEGEILPTGKPDMSNIGKAAEDACNEIVWRDDAQIVMSCLTKVYSDDPRVRIEVDTIYCAGSDVRSLAEFNERRRKR
jgi:Holliday junction resolvase RusA-like endonuclease